MWMLLYAACSGCGLLLKIFNGYARALASRVCPAADIHIRTSLSIGRDTRIRNKCNMVFQGVVLPAPCCIACIMNPEFLDAHGRHGRVPRRWHGFELPALVGRGELKNIIRPCGHAHRVKASNGCSSPDVHS